jgi:hypothetical protein
VILKNLPQVLGQNIQQLLEIVCNRHAFCGDVYLEKVGGHFFSGRFSSPENKAFVALTHPLTRRRSDVLEWQY